MQLNSTFELSMVVDSEKFNMALTRVNNNLEVFDDNENEYIDNTFASKGLMVLYRNTQYKKKIKLIVNQNVLLDSDETDADKLIYKLSKRINGYFNSRYQLNDYNLTGVILATDIDVNSRGNVSGYLKVLQRLGKVKGFSPSSYDCFDDNSSFCLDGNSNGIQFFIYDLESLLQKKLDDTEHGRKQLKSIMENSKGVLRAEVRLTEPKAIRAYTDETSTSEQLRALSKKSSDIFLSIFTHIIPFGNFHKKDQAVNIVHTEIKDTTLKRRMLRLLALIPEKKSLLLAQKALNYRRIDDIMEAFAAIDVSPVTLSKRQDVKQLENLYTYI